MPTQNITNEWQLDRLDQRDLPLDDEYTYEADGTGVRIYIVDSGVRGTHDEFTGRIEAGHSTVGADPHVDTQGHGTAVASAAAGTLSGVAKGATIVPVQVDSDGDPWSRSEVAEGFDWVVANHPGGPAVINFSGGYTSDASGMEATILRAATIFPVVVAAMNNNQDVSAWVPQRRRVLVVVGASNDADAKRSTSNVGPGVDLYAPGENSWVADNSADNAYRTANGSSYATPLVSGVIACILENYPTLSPKQVRDYLVWASTKGRLSGLPSFTPNRLLYSPLSVQTWLNSRYQRRTRRPADSYAAVTDRWGASNPWPLGLNATAASLTPQNFAAAAQSSSSVLTSWDDVTGEDNYRVERRICVT